MSSSPLDLDSLDITSWLKKDRIEKSIESSESSLTEILFGKKQTHPVAESQIQSPSFELLESFLHSLVLDLLKMPEELLKLNLSRRESLARFLSELSKMPEPTDSMERLKLFTRIDRTESEHAALKQLFKQIGIVQIGKALLLKSWRTHSHKDLPRAELKDITGAIERELRSFIHLQTSTCQLIQRNFYSWYKMTTEAQEQLFEILEKTTDLEAAKHWLLDRASSLSAETLGERERYSQGFYENLWKSVEKNKLFNPRSENPVGFSPTLRNGSLMENAPKSIEWVGFEPLSFELLFCEIRYLWKEPKSPPLWVKGTGLEMSMEQQGSLLLTHCGKQNVLQQMDSISCCEIALIAEETQIRTQGRSLAAQALRKMVDQHSILKKLKQPTTTRGMYQACQALEKLRQGGMLIWAREELLTEASGKQSLQFILNQAKILLIADLSAITSAREDLKRDTPKVIYLLKKESNLEERKSHRPLLIKAYGNLAHEQETALLLDRIMALVQKPEQSFPLEPFQLRARVSPMDQREWEQHWFNPSDDELVDQIEELKRNSSPLGQLAHIRTIHPSIRIENQDEPSLLAGINTPQETGFYTWVESNKNGNEIFTASPAKLPEYMKNGHALHFITPVKPEWSATLQMLVRSPLTRDWFNYSIERKKGAWLVKEGDLKSIPVPKHLSDALLSGATDMNALSTNEAKTLSTIGTDPARAVIEVENHPHLKPQAFILAAQVLSDLESHQGALFSLVSPDEEIHYGRFFDSVLEIKDLSPLNHHPLVRYTPTLTSHQSIQTISLLKFPTPGILLTTGRGLTQTLFIQDAWLRDRCFELIKEVQNEIAEPTWVELTKRVRLPKNPDQAQIMSQQILKAYASEKLRRKELNHLLSVCLSPRREHAEKIGLLQ